MEHAGLAGQTGLPGPPDQAPPAAAQAEVVAGLVARARRGDQRAWDDLVERFLPLVSALVARHRLRGQDADDVDQTVWLRLVEHLDDLREPRALPGWIATTTRHECLRVIDRARRTVAVDPRESWQLDQLEQLGEDGVEVGIGDALEALELQKALRAALGELPADRRELLTLLLADPPLPYREISRLLGIPVGSIGPTRARALEQLRHTRALREIVVSDAGHHQGRGRM